MHSRRNHLGSEGRGVIRAEHHRYVQRGTALSPFAAPEKRPASGASIIAVHRDRCDAERAHRDEKAM